MTETIVLWICIAVVAVLIPAGLKMEKQHRLSRLSYCSGVSLEVLENCPNPKLFASRFVEARYLSEKTGIPVDVLMNFPELERDAERTVLERYREQLKKGPPESSNPKSFATHGGSFWDGFERGGPNSN